MYINIHLTYNFHSQTPSINSFPYCPESRSSTSPLRLLVDNRDGTPVTHEKRIWGIGMYFTRQCVLHIYTRLPTSSYRESGSTTVYCITFIHVFVQRIRLNNSLLCNVYPRLRTENQGQQQFTV